MSHSEISSLILAALVGFTTLTSYLSSRQKDARREIRLARAAIEDMEDWRHRVTLLAASSGVALPDAPDSWGKYLDQ